MRSLRRFWAVAGVLALGACARKVCHEPADVGVPGMGDANADGAVDVSDGLYVERWLFAGGPAPACDAVADAYWDENVDVLDGVTILNHVALGNELHELVDGTCVSPEAPADDLDCGVFAYGIDAPARATGELDATVTLDAPDLDVEGWQVGVKATGCTVTEASLVGTAGAPTTEGGARKAGFAHAEPTSGGAVSVVALDWQADGVLPASGDARAILALHVTASPPASGCSPCELEFDDAQAGSGEAIRNVVSRKGRSWRPTTKGAKVRICAG